jgi:glycerophosphoryl diester phosphodiesterase
MSEPYRPIIVAHRGLHHGAPENSYQAFRLAEQAGVPWVECDVWPSADGAVVVIHDETLDRTTTGRGPVRGRRWVDLSPLWLRYADGAVDEHSRVPSLGDLIGFARDGGRPGLLVEVKPPDDAALVRRTIDLLDGQCPQWMVQSFDEANLVHARARDVKAPVAFLVEDRASLERGMANGWKNIHLLHELLDEPTAQRLRAAGVSVGVWTPNAAADLRRVMDLRADMIITDEPVLAMDVLRRR